jgi:hypothetical protein
MKHIINKMKYITYFEIKMKFSLLLYSIYINIYKQLKLFLRLNIISLKLDHQYKLNKYFIILLLCCIISSIIIRTSLIVNDNDFIFIKNILVLLTILYSIKLIFFMIKRIIQTFKIIPQFFIWYKKNIKCIKSIIVLYYIQNLLLISLSNYILYNIFTSLNLYIENISLYIISIGVVISLTFLHFYPLKEFKLYNVKDNPFWVFITLMLTFLFYIFIFPYIIIKLVNTYDLNFPLLNTIECQSDSDLASSSIKIENNNKDNTIINPNVNNTEISNNNSANTILIKPGEVHITVNNNNNSTSTPIINETQDVIHDEEIVDDINLYLDNDIKPDKYKYDITNSHSNTGVSVTFKPILKPNIETNTILDFDNFENFINNNNIVENVIKRASNIHLEKMKIMKEKNFFEYLIDKFKFFK